MQEYQCVACMSLFLIEKPYHPAPSPMKVLNCPFCASTNVVCQNFEVDRYWFDLSEYLGFERSSKGADIIQQIYKTWSPNEFGKFKDYIDSIRPEIELLFTS